MNLADIINNIIQIIFINIFTYLVYVKLINYKENNRIKTSIISFFSIIEGIIGTIGSIYISILPSMIIVYFIHSALIAKITNNKFQYTIIATCMSLALTYTVYIICMIISLFTLKLLVKSIQMENIGILFVGVVIESFVLYKLFKIKRLKNGISFLQNKEKINNIGIIGLIIMGTTLLIYSLFDKDRAFKINESLIIGIIILSICMIIWISKKLTAFYKKKLKEQTIVLLEGEIKEKDKEISKILEENKVIATINHKYSSRIKSIEKVSAKIFNNPKLMAIMKSEFGDEFADFDKQVKQLSKEYSNEINDKVKHKNNLPKTGIFGIDNLLEYMSDEASSKNIKFDLKINGNIHYMVENVIHQSKLETLLGDHIKDAIIAIEHSTNSYKSILAIIGIVDDCYEVCIYDTGIEFEIDTLLNLGTKAITTHKETGGSGIGFMTTFETLKETKASLIIEEKHEVSNKDFTKAVKIRFDGKEEYKLHSYRADEIRNHNKCRKIIIENIK